MATPKMHPESESRKPLTAERLREVLHYDPTTGLFTWRSRRGGSAQSGTIAGSVKAKGYRNIKIDRRLYAAARLAWFYVLGEWPAAEVDHEDRNRDNNRFDNLRAATRSENMRNSGARPKNRSGLKGVSVSRGRWQARITVHRKIIHLGCFGTAEEAHAAYAVAARRLHGEFSFVPPRREGT